MSRYGAPVGAFISAVQALGGTTQLLWCSAKPFTAPSLLHRGLSRLNKPPVKASVILLFHFKRKFEPENSEPSHSHSLIPVSTGKCQPGGAVRSRELDLVTLAGAFQLETA